MELLVAMTIPGALTILVVVLSWIYLKNAARLASPSLITELKTRNVQEEKCDGVKEQLVNTQADEKNSLMDEDLQEELKKYMIKSSDISKDVSVPVPLDDDIIQHEMKEKGFENIHTYYKTSKLQIKEMEDLLTGQEREQEKEAQRKQLEDIFKLMAQEKEKFGVESMDQVEDQMKLYVQ